LLKEAGGTERTEGEDDDGGCWLVPPAVAAAAFATSNFFMEVVGAATVSDDDDEESEEEAMLVIEFARGSDGRTEDCLFSLRGWTFRDDGSKDVFLRSLVDAAEEADDESSLGGGGRLLCLGVCCRLSIAAVFRTGGILSRCCCG